MPVPVIAAGGVVLRGGGPAGPEVVLVHRPRYDDWSFPKGKQDPGETVGGTALREVWEETGLRCVLRDYLGPLRYDDEADRPKIAHYWLMLVTAHDPFVAGREIDQIRWVGIAGARELLARPVDRRLLDRAARCHRVRP